MHVRRKNRTWLQSATDRVTDPDWRKDVIDQASDKAVELASDVAQRSSDLGSHVAERMTEVAHHASDEAHTLLSDRGGKPRRRHRLRNLALLTGAGAVGAYFLDPQNGSERRAKFRTRTSTSARHLGNGLDRAAHAAHEAADVTATDAAETQTPTRVP